ncbi:MAG: PLP-dependent aminotransferase family protein [Eubacteriaceae bacterium]
MIIPRNKGQKPLYKCFYEYIKNEIRLGNLKKGDRLPSKRDLAFQNSVSVNTVDAAYSQLFAEGYIESRPRSGFYVCEIDEYIIEYKDLNPLKKAMKKKESSTGSKVLIDFSPIEIDQKNFPYGDFKKVFKGVFNEYDLNLLKKPDIQGELLLRKALVQLLHRTRGVNCFENQIVIGGGTDNLLQTLSYLWGSKKVIALENPVYLKAFKIFQRSGNCPKPVDIDEKGIKIDPLYHLGCQAVYVTPSHQFPLGMSMPIDRRIQLLNFANKNENTYIIEDDYDSEFRYNEKPYPSLQSIDNNGRVIYMGTFSKSIAPSIRISYMVLPETLMENYHKMLNDMISPVSTLEQKMVGAFINEGYFEKHVNKMRKIYKEKRKYLMELLNLLGEEVVVTGENAGHHLVVQLKKDMREDEMVGSALENGVKVYPISPYFIKGIIPKYDRSVLIGYASLEKKEIEAGVKLLKLAWKI